MNNCYLGIDVGGTNVKVGLVDVAGQIIAKTSTATPPLKTPEKIFKFAMDFATHAIASQLDPAGLLAGVGLAVPGVLDTKESMLLEVVNLPGWVDRPLRRILAEATGLPSVVMNDANAAAYAEHTRRRLGQQSLALVTLGTGIGCGLVVDGKPHGGDHGCAGELGHIAIRFGDDALPCTCGSRGHLESYAGSAGVISRLRSAVSQSAVSQIAEVQSAVEQSAAKLVASKQGATGKVPAKFLDELLVNEISPREIARLAESGNPICRHVIIETAQYVGQAIGMLGQTIDPAVVLLGGAMTFGGMESQVGIEFISQVRQTVKDTTLVQVGGNLSIDFAALGNDAGAIGAALAAKHSS